MGTRRERVAGVHAGGAPFIVVFFGSRTVFCIVKLCFNRSDCSTVSFFLY